jgi:hypothetical protein
LVSNVVLTEVGREVLWNILQDDESIINLIVIVIGLCYTAQRNKNGEKFEEKHGASCSTIPESSLNEEKPSE